MQALRIKKEFRQKKTFYLKNQESKIQEYEEYLKMKQITLTMCKIKKMFEKSKDIKIITWTEHEENTAHRNEE